MKKINSFDFSVKNYDLYQDNIKNLYPGEHLTLSTLKKDNGYTDIEVKAYFGSVGFLFGEDGNEILKYIENPTMYYIDTYVKKFLIKDAIKLALVVIIDVYEKDENFVEPKYEFLGDYHTDSKKYIWGEIMDEISPMKCSVSGINNFPHIAEQLSEWEDCKLIINGDVLDVYSEQGSKFGNLSKQTSQKLILYLKNPDNFLTVNISSIRQNDYDKWSCRLEISIYEKRQLIEDPIKKEARQQRLKKIEEEDKKNAPIYQIGCFIGVIGMIGLVGMLLKVLFINNEVDDTQNNWFYVFVVMAVIGSIPMFMLQRSIEKSKEDIEQTEEYKKMKEKFGK